MCNRLSNLILFITVCLAFYSVNTYAGCPLNTTSFTCCRNPPAFSSHIWKRIGGGCGYTKAGSVIHCQAIPGYPDGVKTEWKKSSCDHLNPKPSSRSVKIFTIIEGKKCGLEWAGGKGDPVGENERVAKFDCDGNADTMNISKSGSTSFIFSNVEGERCSLEWSAKMGSFSGINKNESLAKFDCDTNGDPLFISGNKIYTVIEGKKCYLEWSAGFGGGRVGAKEKAAKFDCGNNAGDAMIFQ